ncbi:protein NYNRIN-like [Podarcis lilfordi]|uniref:ribonuclease H n=1 Tax=Podarcis lilfordi TaxID=74358 RepID=A0AA35LFD0_9SAUR|nr:protein NYNRIN-like [Podarcis lilfordi]
MAPLTTQTLLNDPDWNYNTDNGIWGLKIFKKAILDGIKAAGQRTVNWTKVQAVLQGPDEHPSDYYSRLVSAIKTWGGIDPESPQHEVIVKGFFKDQATPDIRKALNSHLGYDGKTINEILSIAKSVFNTRDERKRKDQRPDLPRVLAYAAGVPNPKEKFKSWGPELLDDRVCYNCNEVGHIRRNCPLVTGSKRIEYRNPRPYQSDYRETTHPRYRESTTPYRPNQSPTRTQPYAEPPPPQPRPRNQPHEATNPFKQGGRPTNPTHEMTRCCSQPHHLLSTIPEGTVVYSVIDLCSAFFSIPVDPESQFLFAFTWQTGQLTWTRLPQGYVESPAIFSSILHQDLLDVNLPGGSALRLYVDDILLCGRDLESCKSDTIALLTILAHKGHKVSPKKIQYCQKEVKYLGHILGEGTRALATDRIEAITKLPLPKTKRQLRGFIGMSGFCRAWIPRYGEFTRPYYLFDKLICPSPLAMECRELEVGESELTKYIIQLQKQLIVLHRYAAAGQNLPLDENIHPFQPGDWILAKTYQKVPLQPTWEGPYQVLLTTPTSVKVAEKSAWLHHTRCKPSSPPDLTDDDAPYTTPPTTARGRSRHRGSPTDRTRSGHESGPTDRTRSGHESGPTDRTRSGHASSPTDRTCFNVITDPLDLRNRPHNEQPRAPTDPPPTPKSITARRLTARRLTARL